MAAKKRKAGDKKSGAKATSARRAVNIKVNVVSKNPVPTIAKITGVDIRDTGFTTVDWKDTKGKSGSTSGMIGSAHVQALVKRAMREGIRVKWPKNIEPFSTNPRRRKRRVAKRAPARRVAKRSTSKRKVARFVICARTRGGKRFYETRARKFIADRKQARLFPSQAAASKEAHRMLSKMPATVRTLAVERA